jgi:hypothetical protein
LVVETDLEAGEAMLLVDGDLEVNGLVNSRYSHAITVSHMSPAIAVKPYSSNWE